MAVTAFWYAQGIKLSMNGLLDWNSDTVKCALLDSGYTPSRFVHDYFDDVSGDEVSGTGYTAGGATLANCGITVTAANSWGENWTATTAYILGDVVKPTAGNTHLYRCIVAGTSGGTEPASWSTVSGQVVSDNTITWAECGGGILVFDADDPSWAASTITARYAVIYHEDGGGAAASPLLFYIDFGANKVSDAGTFTIVFDATYGIGTMTTE